MGQCNNSGYLGDRTSNPEPQKGIRNQLATCSSSRCSSAAGCKALAQQGHLQLHPTRIYGSLVLSVLLYGAECWPIMHSQLQRLEIFHHRCLRRILRVRRSDDVSIEELRASVPHTAVPYWHTISRLCCSGWSMSCRCLMSASPLVLFCQLRGTRPVGSSPATIYSLMPRDVLHLLGGGGQCMVSAGITSAWRRLHSGPALIRCMEVFSTFRDLEIHLDGSQGPP
jgi:hypothetical protein